MKMLDIIQGTPEWHAHRATHLNASDAPAMLGVSPYTTRTALLDRMAGKLPPEVDPWKQRMFDDGHRCEALARGVAEGLIGSDLYPIVGIVGLLSASFDGMTMNSTVGWEHKQLTTRLRELMFDGIEGRELPVDYRVQMEQQCMVGSLRRVLFTASDWDEGGRLVEARHCWYYPDPELRKKIVAGWAQFQRDLAQHVPTATAAPKPTGAAPDMLPALLVELRGDVVASNVSAFREHARAVIAAISTDLRTDQDFADAEATVKWCSTVEHRLDAAKQHALAQTASIDELFRTIDGLSDEVRRKRLDLTKLVAARKETIRQEIADTARREVAAHVEALNASLSGIARVAAPADLIAAIGDAMKGRRTIETLTDAAGVVSARVRGALAAQAERFLENWRAGGQAHRHLLPDFGRAGVGDKDPEDFSALLQLRQHQHREALERSAREQAEREAAAAAAEAQRQELQRIAAETAVAVSPPTAVVSAPAAIVPPAAPIVSKADTEPATLTLGAIAERLGFALRAEFLAGLGFEAQQVKASKLYRESDFPRICDELVAHVNRVRSER